MAGEGWEQVWESRRLEASRGTLLSRLLAADGFDTAFSEVTESSWREFVQRRARDLNIRHGTSVFEVGCGAGAFLYELGQAGCHVSGIDRSSTLVGYARQSIPEGRFEVAEATTFDLDPEVDVVVSCFVFYYFPSLSYARRVVARMVAKARRAVAILGVPDLVRRDTHLEYRWANSGGRDAYIRRYPGLDHLYYDRSWLADTLRTEGLIEIQVSDQDLAGYGQQPFHFNCWGFKSGFRSASVRG